jgi:hypothetical protein
LPSPEVPPTSAPPPPATTRREPWATARRGYFGRAGPRFQGRSRGRARSSGRSIDSGGARFQGATGRTRPVRANRGRNARVGYVPCHPRDGVPGLFVRAEAETHGSGTSRATRRRTQRPSIPRGMSSSGSVSPVRAVLRAPGPPAEGDCSIGLSSLWPFLPLVEARDETKPSWSRSMPDIEFGSADQPGVDRSG